MQRSEIAQRLKQHLAEHVLEGKDVGLDEHTPLLEWGIINSIEIVRLLGFIQEQLKIAVPPEKLTADYFVDLVAITDLVVESIEREPVQQE